MGKKNLAIYTLGRLRRRKNFSAAEGGRQIFWVDPWEVDPWVTKFSLPLYAVNRFNLSWSRYLPYVHMIDFDMGNLQLIGIMCAVAGKGS